MSEIPGYLLEDLYGLGRPAFMYQHWVEIFWSLHKPLHRHRPQHHTLDWP